MAHRISSQARADLDDIWYQIVSEGGSESSADRMVDLIAGRFLLLSDWPRLGRARLDLRRGLRSFPAGDYVIFYRITRAGVVIQRVLHGRRDMARILGPRTRD
jgi:toxin ParE1/3/4